MDEKRHRRGIPPEQQRLWQYQIEKEDNLRLKWFKKNEQSIVETATRKNIRQVPEDVKEEMQRMTVDSIRHAERHTVEREEEEPFFARLDERALRSIMKPVPKEVTDLLYSDNQSGGRIAYLTERYKVIPEDRYYFPETTSFRHGWNMWQEAKRSQGSPFARQQVIKNSFYRRRGVERDPDWYREPARLSPNVCGCI